jgi:hypothetical protein
MLLEYIFAVKINKISQAIVMKFIRHISKSISTGAQYVTLDNKIKCLSLAVFFWATPPIKL